MTLRRRSCRPLLVPLFALLALAAPAGAAPVPVSDASFEDETEALGNGILGILLPPLTGTLGGWEVSRGGLVVLTEATVPRMAVGGDLLATDGTQVANVQYVSAIFTFAEFFQDTGTPWSGDTTYTLAVDVLQLSAFDDLFDSLTFELTGSGGTVASSATDLLSATALGPEATRYVVQFTTGAVAPAGDIGVLLRSDNPLGLLGAIGFDNVTLEAVPEPAPGPLVGVGIALLAQRRRRARAQSVASATPCLRA